MQVYCSNDILEIKLGLSFSIPSFKEVERFKSRTRSNLSPHMEQEMYFEILLDLFMCLLFDV